MDYGMDDGSYKLVEKKDQTKYLSPGWVSFVPILPACFVKIELFEERMHSNVLAVRIENIRFFFL